MITSVMFNHVARELNILNDKKLSLVSLYCINVSVKLASSDHILEESDYWRTEIPQLSATFNVDAFNVG